MVSWKTPGSKLFKLRVILVAYLFLVALMLSAAIFTFGIELARLNATNDQLERARSEIQFYMEMVRLYREDCRHIEPQLIHGGQPSDYLDFTKPGNAPEEDLKK